MYRICAVMLLALVAGACSRPQPGRPLQQAVVSPHGEPLGRAGSAAACNELLAAWIARVDRDRNGEISQAEWMADAEAWFSRADSDQDGFVTVSELTALRRSLEPAEAAPPSNSRDPRIRPVIDRSPDPVMAADTNLDFRVSQAEFRLLSEKRYALKARGSVVDRDSVLADCRGF